MVLLTPTWISTFRSINNLKSIAMKKKCILAIAVCVACSHVLFGQEIPITTSSKEAKKIFMEGREKMEALEFISATELLEKAIALDPNFALAYIYRSQSGGGFVVARQNREKAFSLIDKITPGEKLWILATKANSEANRADFVKYSEELLQLFPKDKRVLCNMGLLNNFNQDYSNAISFFNKALEIDKNYALAINSLGYAYMSLENWAEAEKMFKRQITLLPNYPNPYDSYAQLLMKTGRYDDAITNYQTAMEKSPAFINSFSGMGLAYCHKGDFQKARECYQKQFERAPNPSFKTTSLDNKVNSYVFEGNLTAALKGVEEIRALAQQEKLVAAEVNSYGVAGIINLELGDLAEAARQFEMARTFLVKSELSPTSKEGFSLNQIYQRCALLSKVREFEMVDDLMLNAKTLVDKRMNSVEERNYVLNRARHELDKGNYDNVITLCQKAPLDIYGWHLTARAHEGKGDREKARKFYEMIVNWNGSGLTYALIRPHARQKLSITLGNTN
jgi:tetratricopeptide (TPR) repeat protein